MISLAFHNLFRHKARTILSLLGIVLGVAAIIVMVAVIDGIQDEIVTALSQLQGVQVLEADSMGPMFSQIDESYTSKLESIQGVRVAVPTIMGLVKNIDGETVPLSMSRVMVYGMDISRQSKTRGETIVAEITKGEELVAGEKGKVMLGEAVAEDYSKFVGSSIKVNGKRFKVKGIFKMNSPLMETTIVLPIDEARNLLDFPEGKVSMYNLDLVNPEEDKKVAKLINFRYGDELDAASSSQFSGEIESLLGDLRLVVFLVAAIAAIVAGIGIINTMLMSVLERFREIGALKAVGWTNYDVMKMIILESIMIGFIGAIAGVILGYAAAEAAKGILGLTLLVTPMLVAEALAFAIAIGLVAGLYPAFVASKMDPVEALTAE